jgi:NADH-quinone oxidoreductase subunit L
MYQAIVLLPLIGAVIAGIISLVGARARHPGGLMPGADDHHGNSHPVAPSPHVGSMAIDHGHDHSHERVIPAQGSVAAELITTTLLMIACVLAWLAFVWVGIDHEDAHVVVATWISSGDLHVNWALQIDPLTVVMFVVVTTVSAFVHLYSIGYMDDDPHKPRFFSYLSLFTFAMLTLVSADNLVQLFFGWEGVGLMSYLLVGFWYQKPEPNAAAIKAFVVNRVGDFGFALGIFAVFMMVGALDYDTVFAQAPGLVGKTINFLGHQVDALTLICLLLFVGAMGKSAQFLLHTWLPDAMEGPTPVSALIHAATMVTAGVFMVARLSPLFALAPVALSFVSFIAAATTLFAATVALVQNDIKRIVAYSTCSQLGYMFVAMGMGAYSVGMYHLFTHAAFKALLFLCCGSVIVAMHHEQDIRKMGGLRTKMPFTYWTMVIGTLSLTGFPLTAGYYSKDAIIEAAYMGSTPVYLITVVTAALTAFYGWRLIFRTFHGEPADPEAYQAAHEPSWVMLVPLGVLAGGAILTGFPFENIFIGYGGEGFFRNSLKLAAAAPESVQVAPLIAAVPTLMMAIGFAVAWLFYIRRPDLPDALAKSQEPLYQFLLNKWYFDEIYDWVFVRPVFWVGRLLWKGGDGWLIDGLGPDGISARVLDVTRNVVRLETGYLYHYAFAMLIGVAAFVTWFMFHGAMP